MAENFDFEVIPSSRGRGAVYRDNGSTGIDKLAGAAAENFGRILDVAATVVEIQKMQVQADACIGMLREKRLMLAQETEAYVKKMNAETNRVVSKAEVIRHMMHDYYIYGQEKMSSEDFSKIISDMLDRMGEL